MQSILCNELFFQALRRVNMSKGVINKVKKTERKAQSVWNTEIFLLDFINGDKNESLVFDFIDYRQL